MIPVDHDLLALDLHTLFKVTPVPFISKMAVGEYPLEMIPVDHDLLALDLHTLYKDVHVDSDPTSTLQVARVLANFQVIFLALSSVFGVPPVLKGKGVAAQRVAQALSQLMKEQKSHMAPVEHPSVDMMVLIDRQVDMVTPACTQLTYEGLLDEILHVANGAVKVDPAQMEQWRWTRQSWGISSLQCFPLPSNVRLSFPSPSPLSCSPLLPLSFPSLMFASPSPLLPLSHVRLSFPSPSPTQLLHVANGAVEVDPAVMGVKSNARKIKVPLNSNDKLFQDLRGRNFGSAAELLRAKAVEMKSEYANFRQRPQRDASPLRSAAPGDQAAASAAGVGGGEQTVPWVMDFAKKRCPPLFLVHSFPLSFFVSHHLLHLLLSQASHKPSRAHIAGDQQVTNRPAFGALISTEQAILEARSIDSYVHDSCGAPSSAHAPSCVVLVLSHDMWRMVGTRGDTWGHVGIHGDTWGCMETHDKTWGYEVGTRGDTWGYEVGTRGDTWGYEVGTRGNTWGYEVGTRGDTWGYEVGTRGDTWGYEVGTRGDTWGYEVGTRGDTWGYEVGTRGDTWGYEVGTRGDTWGYEVGTRGDTWGYEVGTRGDTWGYEVGTRGDTWGYEVGTRGDTWGYEVGTRGDTWGYEVGTRGDTWGYEVGTRGDTWGYEVGTRGDTWGYEVGTRGDTWGYEVGTRGDTWGYEVGTRGDTWGYEVGTRGDTWGYEVGTRGDTWGYEVGTRGDTWGYEVGTRGDTWGYEVGTRGDTWGYEVGTRGDTWGYEVGTRGDTWGYEVGTRGDTWVELLLSMLLGLLVPSG
ncbi:unnamed protein product [Closterium sp. Naga37s-1]|nr:unnamed protein product [Closterium sp. Naga37s-1]